MDLTKKGPVLLLTGYQAPAAIRRAGTSRIAAWLKNRKVRNSAALARTVVEAAEAQFTALPGEKLAATMVARLAKGVMTLDEEITELEDLIEARFREHPHAEVIQSLPGMGTMLSAEFLAATGGDMDTFGTADRLAGYAGLAPSPRLRTRQRQPPPPTPLPCSAPSTSRPSPACGTVPPRNSSMSASGPRARGTSRRCWHSPAAGPTSCGP